MLRLSSWLALRCKDAEFQAFMGAHDEQEAVSASRALCGVGSRAELDSNPVAASRCHRFIRQPYAAYLNQRSPA